MAERRRPPESSAARLNWLLLASTCGPTTRMIQHAGHQQPRACVDPGCFALARSADPERHMRTKSAALYTKPFRNLHSRVRLADINDKKRLAVAAGPFLGAPCSRGDCKARAVGDDEYGVAVAHVPFRTLRGLRQRRFA